MAKKCIFHFKKFACGVLLYNENINIIKSGIMRGNRLAYNAIYLKLKKDL